VSADTTSTIAEVAAEDEVAAKRIVPYEYDPRLPLMSGHRYPRWRVALRPPEEAAALFKRAKADRGALLRLIDHEYAARAEALQRRWSSGKMAPNQRRVELAEADQERATRESHIERAYQDLTEAAALERVKESAQTAIDRTWAEAMAAHDTTGPNAA